jgi:hypothetical protein
MTIWPLGSIASAAFVEDMKVLRAWSWTVVGKHREIGGDSVSSYTTAEYCFRKQTSMLRDLVVHATLGSSY